MAAITAGFAPGKSPAFRLLCQDSGPVVVFAEGQPVAANAILFASIPVSTKQGFNPQRRIWRRRKPTQSVQAAQTAIAQAQLALGDTLLPCLCCPVSAVSEYDRERNTAGLAAAAADTGTGRRNGIGGGLSG